MSDSLRVTFVVWRDASTDPPEEHDAHLDIPAPALRVRESGPIVVAYHVEDDGWYPIYNGTERLDDLTDQWAPVPEPPGEGAVTLDDLKLARHLLDTEMWHDEADRLRAALDAASAETEEGRE